MVTQFAAAGPMSQTSLSSRARRTASLRLETQSFSKILRTCVLTVFTEMNNSAAISSVLSRLDRSRRTSSSRAVRFGPTSVATCVGRFGGSPRLRARDAASRRVTSALGPCESSSGSLRHVGEGPADPLVCT